VGLVQPIMPIPEESDPIEGLVTSMQSPPGSKKKRESQLGRLSSPYSNFAGNIKIKNII